MCKSPGKVLGRLGAHLRRVGLPAVVSAAALAATPASVTAQSFPGSFTWPENPFAVSLSDELFPRTDEYRFEKDVDI